MRAIPIRAGEQQTKAVEVRPLEDRRANLVTTKLRLYLKHSA
jgi:hypothetical protein